MTILARSGLLELFVVGFRVGQRHARFTCRDGDNRLPAPLPNFDGMVNL